MTERRVIDCANCSIAFDAVRYRWLCPECGHKESCCEGEAQPERAGREGDSQALPIPNDQPNIHDLVTSDLLTRKTLGKKRYGVPLQPWNSRNALLDLYEELLDAVCYLKQRLVEDGEA